MHLLLLTKVGFFMYCGLLLQLPYITGQVRDAVSEEMNPE
jgi:hypothetical protein